MLSLILKQKNIPKENHQRIYLFIKVISNIYNSRPQRIGATREEIHTYLLTHKIRYSPEEITRFLQYMKEKGLIINHDSNYWVSLY